MFELGLEECVGVHQGISGWEYFRAKRHETMWHGWGAAYNPTCPNPSVAWKPMELGGGSIVPLTFKQKPIQRPNKIPTSVSEIWGKVACESLEKAMASHSSALAWKIPWTEEPGGLQSTGSRSQTRLSNFTFTFHSHALKEMATHSSVPGESQGQKSLVGCHLWGRTESDTTEAT